MNPFEFVIAILFMVFAFTIIRHKLGIPVRSMREMRGDPPIENGENDRLRSQVQQLQERIRVLERIVTDRGAETAAQIEALRDHDRIAEEDKARWIAADHGGHDRRDRDARLDRSRGRQGTAPPRQLRRSARRGREPAPARRGGSAQGAHQGARADHRRQREQSGATKSKSLRDR